MTVPFSSPRSTADSTLDEPLKRNAHEEDGTTIGLPELQPQSSLTAPQACEELINALVGVATSCISEGFIQEASFYQNLAEEEADFLEIPQVLNAHISVSQSEPALTVRQASIKLITAYLTAAASLIPGGSMLVRRVLSYENHAQMLAKKLQIRKHIGLDLAMKELLFEYATNDLLECVLEHLQTGNIQLASRYASVTASFAQDRQRCRFKLQYLTRLNHPETSTPITPLRRGLHVLTLPSEIRNMIWEHVIKGDAMGYVEKQLINNDESPKRFPIIWTCRQIHNEACYIAKREYYIWYDEGCAPLSGHRSSQLPLRIATWSNPYDLQDSPILRGLGYDELNLQVLSICSNFMAVKVPTESIYIRALWIANLIQQLPKLKELSFYTGCSLRSASAFGQDFAQDLRDIISSETYQDSIKDRQLEIRPFRGDSQSTTVISLSSDGAVQLVRLRISFVR